MMKMNEKQIEEMAKSLFTKHGLKDWTFKFDNAKRGFGLCRYSIKTISLSRRLSKLNPSQKVIESIFLHEIAHALTRGDHHGKRWKAKCIELGTKPERCFSKEIKTVKGKYTYVCKNCKRETLYHRRLVRDTACGKCCKKFNNNQYSEKYLMELK